MVPNPTADDRGEPGPAPAIAGTEGRPAPAARAWGRYRPFLILCLIALTGAIAYVGVRGYANVGRLIALSEQVDRSREIIATIDEVISRVRSSETNQRGFLLTAREKMLTQYGVSRAALFDRVAESIRLVDDPGERAILARVGRIAEEKYAEMDRTLALAGAGRLDEAIAMVRTDVGQLMKEEMIALTRDVARIEHARLDDRKAQARGYAEDAPAGLALLLGGTVVVVLGLYASVARESRERQRAEAIVRESEARFRGSFEAATSGMALVSPEGRWLQVNPSLCQSLGYTEAEMLATDFPSVTHPDDHAIDDLVVARLLSGETSAEQFQKRYVRKDGGDVHVVLGVTLVRDDAGRPLHFVATINDVTERVLAEAKSGQDRRFITSIADAVPSLLYVFDVVERRNIWSNARIKDLLGRTSEEFAELGDEILAAVVHPDSMRAMAAHLAEVAAGEDGRVFEVEYRMLHADGTYRWFRNRSLVFSREADGRVRRIIGSAEDIDERRRAGAELAAAQARLGDAIESLESGLIMFDADDRLVLCNRRYREMYPGVADLLVVGRSFGAIAAEVVARERPDLDEGGRLAEAEARVGYHRDHRGFAEVAHGDRWHRVGDFPTSLGGVVSLHNDITTLKAHEADLRRARDAAQAGGRAKAEFLANMSHEIRTPMNGVLGMADLALGTPLSPRQREYVSAIKSSAESLLTVINDILDFSKVEAGKLDLDRIPFSLRTLLDDTLRSFAPRAHEKGLELCVRVGVEVPDVLLGDPHRLRQVLVNLVGNAVKFTARGEVVVSVDLDACPIGEGGERSARLAFSVLDTGIGIPEDRREAIFEPFEQADGSTTRKYGGTGLGLAISGKLVTLMGGAIRAEGREPKGSVFRFTARFGRPDEAETLPFAAPTLPSSLAGLRVLVLDEHAVGREILAELLESWRMEAFPLADIRDGLAEIREAGEAGRPFAAALVAGETNARVVAATGLATILLSSEEQPGGERRASASPYVGRLAKPVRQSDLFDALVALVGEAVGVAAPAARPGAPAAAVGRPLRVLLAEDNAVNQVVATHMLERLGHRAVVVPDGREALAALDSGLFDLVLMDLQMPEMDGFQAVAAIRDREANDPDSRRLPVVALTAHAMAGDKERCLSAGFDAYLSKPIRSDDLCRTINALAEESRPAPPAPTAEAVFRPETLAESCAGLAEIILEVLDSFRGQAPADLAKINGALRAGDIPSARRAAHGLKGACFTIGAEALAASCSRIEHHPEGDPAPSPERTGAELDLAWASLRTAIDAHCLELCAAATD